MRSRSKKMLVVAAVVLVPLALFANSLRTPPVAAPRPPAAPSSSSAEANVAPAAPAKCRGTLAVGASASAATWRVVATASAKKVAERNDDFSMSAQIDYEALLEEFEVSFTVGLYKGQQTHCGAVRVRDATCATTTIEASPPVSWLCARDLTLREDGKGGFAVTYAAAGSETDLTLIVFGRSP